MSDSSSSFNPDLGSVENPTLRPHVPAPARFKTDVASSTPTPPIVMEKEEKYYVSQVPNASLHTPDGTRITFVHGFFRTSIKHIKSYLERELELGFINSYVREATPEEIYAANMRLDPRGTVTKEVRAQLEPVMRKELEAEILAELLGVNREEINEVDREILRQNADAAKMAGVDVSSRLAALRASVRGIAPARHAYSVDNPSGVIGKSVSGEGVVVQPVHPMQAGMVGSDKISAGAADGVQSTPASTVTKA